MIRDFSPFPHILPNRTVQPGILYGVTAACAGCATRECSKEYDSAEAGKVRTCFKELNYVRLMDFGGESIVWNGFLLKGRKYPKNYRDLLREGYELDFETIKRTAQLFSTGGAVHKSTLENQKRGESRALHDLKHLVSALARVVESNDIRRATDREVAPSQINYEIMQSTIISVYNILGAIKNQLEMSDFILAPESVEFVNKREIDIFPLFDKNVRMYDVLAHQQGKSIRIRSISGFIRGTRFLKEYFALLPPILLQNAIKYSMENSDIVVEVADIQGKIKIVVKSLGSIIPPEAQERIWKMGEQYVHENDTSKGGGGFGLYLAKMICDGTGFSISYEGSATQQARGVPVGENRFIVFEK